MSKEESLIRPVVNTGFSCCKATDAQVGGNHYKDMKIQPITFIQENNIPFCEANVIKYVCRHRNKNGLEDLLKQNIIST